MSRANFRQDLTNLHAVIMFHDKGVTNGWRLIGPEGPIAIPDSDLTHGLKTGITYAGANGFSFRCYGGGIPFVNDTTPTAYNRIYMGEPINVPRANTGNYHFYGVDFLYDVAGGAPASSDMFTFDTCDMMGWQMYGCQVIYPGTGAAFRFNPLLDNGENFAGVVSSNFRFGTIALVDSVTLAPHATSGIGIRFTMSDGGHGYALGNGLILGSSFHVQEINGGITQIQVDTPATGNIFAGNHITAPFLHSFGDNGLAIGISSATDKIYANQWDVGIGGGTSGSSACIETYGGASFGGDLFNARIYGGTGNGIVLNSSARKNIFNCPIISVGGGIWVDSATINDNILNYTTKTRTTGSAGSSPWTYHNTTGRTISMFLSGTVTAVALSLDNSTFDSAANPPTNTYYTLLPGMYIKVTYSSSAPFYALYY